MYGTQTENEHCGNELLFENDVELYGTQTSSGRVKEYILFENDVELYGTQTIWTERTQNT